MIKCDELAVPTATGAGRRAPQRRCHGRIPFAVACALALLPPESQSQTTIFEPSVRAELTWSDNANFSAPGLEQKDTIFDLIGDVVFRRTGPRLGLVGTVGFDALQYLDNTQQDRVLPRADVKLTFEALEDFFFVDAGLLVGQEPIDVFGVRSGSSSASNKVTTSQYQLLPSLKGRFSEALNYLVRSDNTWTDSSQATTLIDDAYFGRHTVRVDRLPVPLGGFASFDSSTTKYADQATPTLRDDIARLGVNYAFTPQLQFGIRGGHERAEGVVQETEETIYGAQFDWRPSDRTALDGFYENRFFGDSWQLRFSHRMPRVAWNISSSRDISTSPELLLTLPPTSNLAALIDAALTTRVPDADARAQAVRQVLNSTGLPNTLSGPTSLYTERVLIVTRTAVTVTLLGVRNNLGLSLYQAENRDLAERVASIIAPDTSLATNNRESGAALAYSLRMTTLATFSLSGDWIRTRGLDANADQESTQKTLQAQLSHQLGPKTNAIVGVRYLNLDSNVGADSKENAAFIAVGHRF